ncbi:radical SAM protein [Campylobacter fetus]|nr:radical SAM protein [Campylobacter fetus]EJU9540905.1 radical SAM protein [Campylobacter fetus]
MKFSLDAHKLHHHLDRVLEFKQTGDCAPIYMEVSPCGSCNHRCLFCAYDYIAYPNIKLDTDNFIKFTTEVAKAGLKSMLFAGEGEPLIHNDIDKMVAHAKQCGIDCGMFSNAALLKADLAKKLLPNLTFLRFSFNAGDSQTYSKIHTSHKKSSDFEKVVENIKFANDYRKEQNLKVDLGSQFVLLKENKNSLINAVKTMKECGVDYISVKPFVLQNENQLYKNNSKFETDQLETLINEAKSYESDDFKVIFRQNAFFKYGQRDYSHCYGCSFITVLNSAGDLASCLPYWDKKEFVYGNINEQSFEAIWGGVRRKRVKELLENKINTKNCPPNCRPNAINEFLNEILNPDVKHINFI